MPRAAASAYKEVMDAPSYLVGQFLLAMPGIGDPRFEKAVVAMCVHDEAGALGIGLGELVPRLRLHDLLAQLDIPAGEAPNAPIHHGGPVEPQRGFILHTPDWGGQDSIEVAGRWVLSATLDVLRAIAEGKGPSRWVVALGYAGWGPGQLDADRSRPCGGVRATAQATRRGTSLRRRGAAWGARVGATVGGREDIMGAWASTRVNSRSTSAVSVACAAAARSLIGRTTPRAIRTGTTSGASVRAATSIGTSCPNWPVSNTRANTTPEVSPARMRRQRLNSSSHASVRCHCAPTTRRSTPNACAISDTSNPSDTSAA